MFVYRFRFGNCLNLILINFCLQQNGLFDRQKIDNKSHSTTETWSNETTDNGYLTGRLLNVVTDGKNPSLNL